MLSSTREVGWCTKQRLLAAYETANRQVVLKRNAVSKNFMTSDQSLGHG